MPTIPCRPPEQLFSIEVPYPYSGFVERPVVAGDSIVVTGDDGCMAAFDGETGKERFVFSVPREATELYAGLPLPFKNGILLPIYQKDAWLRVFYLNPSGELAADDNPGAEEEARGGDTCIVAYDVGSKLFLMPLACGADDDYLISWIYRQVRCYRTECRSLAQGLRWAGDEALLATSKHVALGVTAPLRGTEDHGTWIARELRSGKELWSRPALHRTVATSDEEHFFILDRSARMAEDRVRKMACDEELLDALADAPEFMEEELDRLERRLFAARPVRAPSKIAAIEAQSGAVVWETELPGEVVSIEGPGSGTLAAVAVHGSEARLVRLDARSGALIGASSLGSNWPPSPLEGASTTASLEIWVSKMPAIVAIDEHAILWASPEALFAEARCAPFNELWQWPLSTPCRGFRPRRLDRVLNAPTIAVGEGRIYLREGRRLTAIGARAAI